MPAEISIRVNGEAHRLPAGATIDDLIGELGLKPGQVAVERNGKLVPRDQHVESVLETGDVLEVVTLVGGG